MENVEEIINRIKNGEKQLFEEIIHNYQQQIFKYCYYMLGHVEETKDAVQDVFIKAYEKLNTYKENISFTAWLHKIAYNHCLNIIRRRKIIEFLPFKQEILCKSKHMGNLDNGLENESLHVALSKLSLSERSLIILRVVEERSYEEISKMMDIKSTTLRKKYQRAKSKLKIYFNQIEGVDSSEGYSYR